MNLPKTRYTILVGNYGSGKTELSLALALEMRKSEPESRIALVDLDIVNPYFRSAEQSDLLRQHNIEVFMPSFAMSTVDIPALPANIKAVFELRFLSIIGFEPLYGSCFACGKELIDVSCGGETEDGAAFFNTEEVGAVCRSCSALLPSKRALIPASKALLKAIAYSATAPVDKVFSFKTDAETEKLLAQIAETVVLEHIEIRPKSLKVYKDLTVIQ